MKDEKGDAEKMKVLNRRKVMKKKIAENISKFTNPDSSGFIDQKTIDYLLKSIHFNCIYFLQFNNS